MAENLNYNVQNSWCGGGSNYDEGDCSVYGRLYEWTAALTACPTGWHLPSKDEWETLFAAVGGQSTAGQKLKATTGWNTNSGITNEDAYGYAALPAGNRNNGGYFIYVGFYAYFWSATEGDSYDAYNMGLIYNYDHAYLDVYYKKYYGFSVRCLQD